MDSPPLTTHDYNFKPDDPIGNRYRVVKHLGFGGFAEVYLCEDIELTRFVAVKVLNTTKAALQEARAAAQLDHPNIVHVYEVSALTDGKSIIVFRYIEGGTLHERLDKAQYRRLSLDKDSLHIIRSVAEALDFAHAKNVVHRDVKPSNIILDPAGNAYLTDFGLAEVKLPGERLSMFSVAMEQRLSGTIPYMAPEQLKDGNLGDKWSDQYSLGVVVYEMLTGQFPHKGRDTSLIFQIASSDPLPPTQANAELPKGVEPVLLRVLDKDPKRRYESCSAFAKELEAAAQAYVEASDKYDRAIQYYEAKEWRRARDAFQELEHQAPGFKDVGRSLEQTKQKVRLLELYERARTELDQNRFQKALDTLSTIAELDSEYSVADLRQKAIEGLAQQEKRSLDEQYQRAVEQYHAEDYQACLDTLEVIRNSNPDYPDHENIEAPAREHAARQRQLKGRYARGLELMRQEQWDEAIVTFQELLNAAPGYDDVQTQLAMARPMARMSFLLREAGALAEQAAFSAAADRLAELQSIDPYFKKEEVATLVKRTQQRMHEHALHLLHTGEFEACLLTLEELDKLFQEATDTSELKVQAQEGMRVRDLRAQLDRLYQQAAEQLKQRAYREALQTWNTIQTQKTDLDYTDPREIERQAREGLCTSLYAEALGALASNDPAQAQRLWRQVLELDAGYRDSQQVEERAADMLRHEMDLKAEQAQQQQREARRAALRRWTIRAGMAVALLAIALVVILPRMLVASPDLTATPTSTSTTTPTQKPASTTAVPATATPTKRVPTTPASTTPARTTAIPTTPATMAASTTPTASRTVTRSLTPSATAGASSNTATANQSASIYASPNSGSAQLAFIRSGEQVSVLGRSSAGQWFYVRKSNGVEGFASVPRFDWSGDFSLLSVKSAPRITIAPRPTAIPSISSTSSGPLEFDLWPIAGAERCEAGRWFQRVYMQGRGGNGSYTYYWNGEKKAGPITTGFDFEMSNSEGAIIGSARIVSGDGQEINRNLFVPAPDCSH